MHRRGCPRPCVMAPTWRPLPYVLRFVGAGGAGWLVKVSIPPPTPPPPPPPPGLMRESAASGLGGVWSTLWNLSHVADRSTVPALAPARYGTFYFVFISCLRPVKITLLYTTTYEQRGFAHCADRHAHAIASPGLAGSSPPGIKA
jgi:hypothetical protein